MKKAGLTLVAVFAFLSTITAQDKPAYQLYNQKGKLAKYDKMIEDLAEADMVFFGEYHNNPISHWLQIEMVKSFYEVKGEKLFLGAEMFENGNQLVLNEYLAGLYPEKKMIPEMTQMWRNYKTDYKPLVEFAKKNKLRFIATNIPRRYAALINKKGMAALDSLSPEALAMIGPVQAHFDSTVYATMADAMGEHVPPNMLNIQTAQAAKDATMAQFSLNNFSKGDFLFHFEGSFHSNYNSGIIWWINKIQPGLTIKTIATLDQSEWDELTEEQKATIANYTLVVVDNMTKTNR